MQNKPKLRFKEFNNDWEEKKIKDIGYISMCKRIFREQTSTKGDIPFYKIGTFGKEPDAFISRELFQLYKEKYPYPKTGNILISASGTIGRTVEYNGEDAYYQDSNIIWINHNDLIMDKFLNVIIQNTNWDKVIEGSTIKRLYNNNLLELKISLPCLDEQKKIAEFLSKVDEVIAEREEEVKDLEKQKKGLMQKIFSQQLRFTDSNNNPYPDWEDTILGNIYDFKYGQYNNNPDNGGQYPIYGANGIIGGYTEYNAENSVIIGHMGAYAGSVLFEKEKHFVTYNGTITIPKSNVVLDSKYGYYLLLNLNIRRICDGSGQPFLSYDTLNRIKIKTSKINEEQQKIANVLSKLDELIEEKKALLSDWQSFKKGLLQQMFV